LVAATGYLLTRPPQNVNNADVEFEAAAPTVTAPQATGDDPFDDGFSWPTYGLTPQRTKYLPLKRDLQPPFFERWRMTGSILLEFTPTLCGRLLFLLKNNGALYAISRKTGEVKWKRKLGYLAASSPACDGERVYAVLLKRSKFVEAGSIVAVAPKTGRTIWSRRLPSRSESSPLVIGDRLYFGSENGTVYNLRTTDGAVRWTYSGGGAIKGALAADGGRLFFGDYSGAVTAIKRTDGKRVWRTGTSGGRFGLGGGNFYGTPAAAYGRLYIGNTDGFVYSFGLNSGRLAWRYKTGGYVYSAPAVSPAHGGSVFVGSYDRNMYSLNARNGSVRWKQRTNGRIVGGPTVLGNLVFYSDLGSKSTHALGVNTGRQVWEVGRGAFNPVISDGTRLYLNGYSTLYMFTEKGRRSDGKLTTAARKRARDRTDAAAKRRQARVVARRVEQRKREVRRIVRQRRSGIKVRFSSGGKTVCRIPRKPVCFKQAGGRTVCRAAKPSP
jgi:outer membrane protein assembly factor BamB